MKKLILERTVTMFNQNIILENAFNLARLDNFWFGLNSRNRKNFSHGL